MANLAAGLFITGSLILSYACSKKPINEDTIVATIGKDKITVKDFRISYELTPATQKPKSKNPKKAHLQKLIEKKLLTFAAEENHLDQNEEIQRFLKWYEKQFVIQALYRKVIHDQVHISEEEMRTAFTLLNEKLYLRQLLFHSQTEANKVYKKIRNGATFEQMAAEIAQSDSELQHILQPREFRWGYLDERLETAAYGLNRLEVSAPIKTYVGYHILQLVDRKENIMLTEYDYQNRQHYVETIIRRRKEAKLARAYARKLMEKIHPRANGPVLLELTKRAKKAIRMENSEYRLPPFMQVKKIWPYVQDLLDKKLVVFNQGFWTVKEFLNMVEKAHPKARPDLTNPNTLTVNLSIMVRDEFLAKEGYRQGLEKSKAVQEQLKPLKEEILAIRMRHQLLDTVQVSEKEVKKFYTENLSRYEIPEMVNVREIMVRDHKLADSLYQAIINGADLKLLAQRFSVRKWAAKKGGELGYFAPGAFGNLGKKAFTMSVGEISRPVPIKIDTFTVGYSVFKVIGRKPQKIFPLEEIYKKVEKDALEAKKKTILQNFLANVQKKYQVSFKESILAKIRTTDELGTGRPIDLVKITRY